MSVADAGTIPSMRCLQCDFCVSWIGLYIIGGRRVSLQHPHSDCDQRKNLKQAKDPQPVPVAARILVHKSSRPPLDPEL